MISYRKKAMDTLQSPEELDAVMHVTDQKGWLALLALCGMVLAAIAWGVFTRLPVSVKGQGVLIQRDSIHPIISADTGRISGLTVQVGNTVQAGQVLAKLTTASGALDVTSDSAGVITEILTSNQALVNRGTKIATVQQTDKPLQAVVYVPASEAKRLKTGMLAQISPATVRSQEFGFLWGSVGAVSPFPVSPDGIRLVVGDDRVAQALASAGPVVEVTVNLFQAQTASGFAWSTPSGPPSAPVNGTASTVSFIVGEQRPISMVLPVQ